MPNRKWVTCSFPGVTSLTVGDGDVRDSVPAIEQIDRLVEVRVGVGERAARVFRQVRTACRKGTLGVRPVVAPERDGRALREPAKSYSDARGELVAPL